MKKIALTFLFITIKSVYGFDLKKDSVFVEYLLNMPIKQGNVLEIKSNESSEYTAGLDVPDDIYYDANKIYILSSFEKKLLVYYIKENKVESIEKIHLALLEQKDKYGEVKEPQYVRVFKNYKIIGYFNQIIVFDPSNKLIINKKYNYTLSNITIYKNNIYIWFFDFVEIWDSQKFTSIRVKLQDKISYLCYFFNNIVINMDNLYEIKDEKDNIYISKQKITSISFYGESMFANQKYRVLYNPHSITDIDLILYDNQLKPIDTLKVSSLPINNRSVYFEDRFSGLRWTIDNNSLYLCYVDVLKNGDKNLILLQIKNFW